MAFRTDTPLLQAVMIGYESGRRKMLDGIAERHRQLGCKKARLAAPMAFLLFGLLFGILPDIAAAPDNRQLKPGEFMIDHPTLINLGFEWLIEGDENRNAVVEVSYRKRGEPQWKGGLPMLRLQGERIYQNQGVFDVVSPNMFAGSILDLDPDTEYEARFVMSDSDGIVGQNRNTVTKTVIVRTRAEPKPYSGGRVFHVYPPNYKGTRAEPAFEGLMCAYNYYCGGGDTVTAARPRVKPGDTILMHAGVYKYHAEYYTGDRSINAA